MAATTLYPPILSGRVPATLSIPSTLTLQFEMPTTTTKNNIRHIQILLIKKSNGESVALTTQTLDGVIYQNLDGSTWNSVSGTNIFSYTLQLSTWFGANLKTGVEYSLQIRFGETALPTGGATGTNFASWKVNQTAVRGFGEWSNATTLYFLSDITRNLSWDRYRSPAPYFTMKYLSPDAEQIIQYRLEAHTSDSPSPDSLLYANDWENMVSNRQASTYSGVDFNDSESGCTSLSSEMARLILERNDVKVFMHFITEHGYDGYSTQSNPSFSHYTVNTGYNIYVNSPTFPTNSADFFNMGTETAPKWVTRTNHEEGYVSIKFVGNLSLTVGENFSIWKISSEEPCIPIKIGEYYPTTTITINKSWDDYYEIAKDLFIESGTWVLYFMMVQQYKVVPGGLIELSPYDLYCVNTLLYTPSPPDFVFVAYPDFGPWKPSLVATDDLKPWYFVDGFEHQYLTTFPMQLKLAYNFKISSLKRNQQISTQLTLGGRFPYILKSAVTDYRTFSVTGLISMFSDFSFLFLSKAYRNYPTNTGAFDLIYWDGNGPVQTSTDPINGYNGKIFIYWEQLTDHMGFWTDRQRNPQGNEFMPVTNFNDIIAEIQEYGSQGAYIPPTDIDGRQEIRGPISYFDPGTNGYTPIQYDALDNDTLRILGEEYDYALTTDPTFKNIEMERRFREVVIDFLQNGKPKLFRSSQEGNIIVYPMNVSYAPLMSTRMVYTVTMELVEVAEYNYKNLVDYGILPYQRSLNV